VGKGKTTRPTSSRVREALFSILGQDLAGKTVLDPFAGSGLLSFEALSRGADSAVLIDSDHMAVGSIKRSAADLGVDEKVSVKRGVVPKALPSGVQFSLVFLDPPYSAAVLPIIESLVPLVSDQLVLEFGAQGPEVSGLSLEKSKSYGGTVLTFYRRKEVEF
jgi:16S rRNA (guanine966-N2)-methyltransferase